MVRTLICLAFAVLITGTSHASDLPVAKSLPVAKKLACSCGDSCDCPAGKCPQSCPLAKGDIVTNEGWIVRPVNGGFVKVGEVPAKSAPTQAPVATAPACRTEYYVGRDGKVYERTVCPLKK